MKTPWFMLTCPVCYLRHPLSRYTRRLEPVAYPAQLVTGGGYASGFHVVQYIPWSAISSLRDNPEVWRALNCEYVLLAAAYDRFYEKFGFLSPRMKKLLLVLNGQIFRLRELCRDLLDQLDRFRLNHAGYDSLGSFGRFLEEANKRDKHDRGSVRALLESD
jgi:hypothetical protein